MCCFSKEGYAIKERDAESGLDYFGARYYWSVGGLWLSVDPLADNYPFLSPYVYGACSPVVLVDADGRIIRVYYKTKKGIWSWFERWKYVDYQVGITHENEFVSKVFRSLNYVYMGGGDTARKVIDECIQSKEIFEIYKSGSSFYLEIEGVNVILWRPFGLKIYDMINDKKVEKGRMTAAMGLFHELAHAYRKMKGYFFDDEKEEMEVIMNYEKPVAMSLHEQFRENHLGKYINTPDPIKTFTKRELKKFIKNEER